MASDKASAEVGLSTPVEQRSTLDESVIEEMVTHARRTDASVRFIENAARAHAGGVGALLRFRL
ncbi:MAG: hypothetical protein H0V80_08475 [Acidobacteria bacterium]|nr:hypothetical protein [Acidobacteriota bacterium]